MPSQKYVFDPVIIVTEFFEMNRIIQMEGLIV